MFFHKKPPHHPSCLAFHIVTTGLLCLVAIASLVGVVMAHYDAMDGSLVFGTPAASLALISLAVSLTLCMKQCKSCMSECEVCALPAKKK